MRTLFEGETSEDQKVVTDLEAALQRLFVSASAFLLHISFPWALPPHWLIDITSLEPI